MNTDSTFVIGHDHTICEDYTLSGISVNGVAYAIVCDGCSASPDVDFGARVLAITARSSLSWPGDLRDNVEKLGEAIIDEAKLSLLRLIVDIHCLDSTLLFAKIEKNKLVAFLFGDGVLVRRTKSGINKVHIHLTSGAPDYLSYHLDGQRRDAYDKIEDNNKVLEIHVGDNMWKYNSKPFEPYVLKTEVEKGDVISVISDGINSFRKADNTPIPWTDLVDEFTGYKTTEGEFVLRRILAFKRKCLKEGITHSDDISIASIII